MAQKYWYMHRTEMCTIHVLNLADIMSLQYFLASYQRKNYYLIQIDNVKPNFEP